VTELKGSPSDEAPAIMAVGGSSARIVFVSFSKRHPEGRDRDYLEWHTLDHRPEQHRIQTLVASLRLVSTPRCRRARGASSELFDQVEHVMSYFFTGPDSLADFAELSDGLQTAGRNPGPLPPVDRSVFAISGRAASPRIKISADVLPWWPVKGMYLLVEEGHHSPLALIDLPGVGGAWWADGLAKTPHTTSDKTGVRITYLFLDRDPAETAEDLLEPLHERWADGSVAPLFAAPLHTIVPYDWGRHLP
jgi:hypothetical protein